MEIFKFLRTTKPIHKKIKILVEKDGDFIIKITDPVYYDMFWNAYLVNFIGNNHDLKKKMIDPSFWDDVKYFDVFLNDYINFGIFVASTPFDSKGRLIVREYLV